MGKFISILKTGELFFYNNWGFLPSQVASGEVKYRFSNLLQDLQVQVELHFADRKRCPCPSWFLPYIIAGCLRISFIKTTDYRDKPGAAERLFKLPRHAYATWVTFTRGFPEMLQAIMEAHANGLLYSGIKKKEAMNQSREYFFELLNSEASKLEWDAQQGFPLGLS
ncbi:hypothetical protein ACFL35_00140 [Candidatus Riflebacteria bacterium]